MPKILDKLRAIKDIDVGQAQNRRRRSQLRSKPLAAISNPPTEYGNGDGRKQSPPERQHKIGEQAQGNKDDPENLALHPLILGLMSFLCAPSVLSVVRIANHGGP